MEYRISISRQLNDPEWDEFVRTIPGCPFEQTSMWASSKAFYGFEPIRVLVRGEQGIIGGFQILRKRIPLIGSFGYISKGPLLKEGVDKFNQSLYSLVESVAREYRVRFLVVQPFKLDSETEEFLLKRHFEPSRLSVISATLMIDLSRDPEVLLDEMNSHHRRAIRRARKAGVIVRQGGRYDLPLFFALMLETCKRQGVKPNPAHLEYLEILWKEFGTRGYLKLFLAEKGSEVLSGILAFAFGSVFRLWKFGWKGDTGTIKPNQILHWEMALWAKAAGFLYMDFMAIKEDLARLLLEGRPTDSVTIRGSDLFKIRFGGIPFLLPHAFDIISNPLLRYTFNAAFKTRNLLMDRLNAGKAQGKPPVEDQEQR